MLLKTMTPGSNLVYLFYSCKLSFLNNLDIDLYKYYIDLPDSIFRPRKTD